MRVFREDKILKPRGFTETALPADLPIDLEIGCGAGLHPIQYAQANPDRFLIAIEHTETRFKAFEGRVNRHRGIGRGLDNLLPVHANAIAWVTHALSPGSVDRIFLLYPNPYPKKSDLNKRWHAMPFMGKLVQCLKEEGEIILATNERSYFEEAKEFMTGTWGLRMIEELQFTQENSPFRAPRTHFERKYLARGEICFQLRFRVNSGMIL
jgi:tRNA (guanine-N7-)-methyltransferase